MKIVSPTKATQILQQIVSEGKGGEVTIGLKPDYRVDTTGLASLISLLGLTEETDIEGGGYCVGSPSINVNIRKVDWDGFIVNWDFPDMGQVTAEEEFRNQSSLAMTVNVDAGTTVNLRTNFNTPDNENIQVSWGDSDTILSYNTGTSDNQTALTHTYTNAGKYTIFVKGKLIAGTTRNNDTVTTAIHLIKPIVIAATMGIFAMYEKLTDILGTVILKGNSSTISHFFYNNKIIRNVKGLKLVFPDTSIQGNKILSLKHFFGAGCNDNSPDIKADLINDIQLINFDRNSIENIDTAFISSGINMFPQKWMGKNVSNGYQAFKNCPKIQYIPYQQFRHLTNGEEMFYCNAPLLNDESLRFRITKSPFSNLTNGKGMFGNRQMSFNEIKMIFESLPNNPNPVKGGTGFSAVDGNPVSDYAITFCFDPNEKNIKEKLIEYFKLNTEIIIHWHKNYDAVDKGNRTETYWDGGWYPIYNTHYGHSWDCNNDKGWFVNFRLPHNFGGSN